MFLSHASVLPCPLVNTCNAIRVKGCAFDRASRHWFTLVEDSIVLVRKLLWSTILLSNHEVMHLCKTDSSLWLSL